MDIKINGLSFEIIKQALSKTHEARNYILDKIMEPCIKKSRDNISRYAPKICRLVVEVDRLGDIIGPKGKVIHRIIEESGVDKIDTEDDGRIFIASSDQEKINRAVEMINAIIIDPEPGQIFMGKVMRLMSFGAFIEIAPEREALLHISKLSRGDRSKDIKDLVKLGEIIRVKIQDIDDQGRINLVKA
jgi:polyribonucleotide nucleotidyltransferase